MIPMSGPDITDAEIASVVDVLHSGCLSIGPRLSQFEAAVAARVGTAHAVGVSSGTAGLHLAIIAAGVNDGDLVITTPFSFIASANCILYERAIPVFVDVDPVTGNIDPVLVEAAIRDIQNGGAARQRWLPPAVRDSARVGRLRALLPVHAFGQPADMDPLLKTAGAAGLVVIEDACEAVGSEYKGRPAGSMGDVAVFAFYPNKQATTGEGGMMVTQRSDYDALFRSLRNQGRDVMSGWLEHDRLGYNYRMDELSAALGEAQFIRLAELIAARSQVTSWYTERLTGAPGVTPPVVMPYVTRMSWFAYVVRLDPDVDRDAVIGDLQQVGIPSRPYFSPIHLQSFYRTRFGYAPGDFPVAEALGASCLALPFSGKTTEAQVERVCAALLTSVARRHGSVAAASLGAVEE
jgi:dTDP-4-amino-4,6-dideoxygalactose transaminase